MSLSVDVTKEFKLKKKHINIAYVLFIYVPFILHAVYSVIHVEFKDISHECGWVTAEYFILFKERSYATVLQSSFLSEIGGMQTSFVG